MNTSLITDNNQVEKIKETKVNGMSNRNYRNIFDTDASELIDSSRLMTDIHVRNVSLDLNSNNNYKEFKKDFPKRNLPGKTFQNY